jgi:hypothetical protein
MDIIHRFVFYLKHNISEAGFCPRLQVEPTQLRPIDRASPCLRTQVSTFHLKTNKGSGLRKAEF